MYFINEKLKRKYIYGRVSYNRGILKNLFLEFSRIWAKKRNEVLVHATTWMNL